MSVKKLLLALSLCIVLVLSLFAFEQGYFSFFNEQSLYGVWLTDVPAAEQVERSLAQFGITYDIPDDLKMTYRFEFSPDGTVTVSVDPESARLIAAAEVEALRAGLPELLYNQYLQSAGMSREETDAMLASQGLTMETLVDLSLEQTDFEAQYTSESMTYTQYYCVKNGILCYAVSLVDLNAGNYDMTVEPRISGNTLVLSNAFDSDGNPFTGSGAIQYPMTLRRK